MRSQASSTCGTSRSPYCVTTCSSGRYEAVHSESGAARQIRLGECGCYQGCVLLLRLALVGRRDGCQAPAGMLTWKGPKISVVAASKLSGFSSSLQQQRGKVGEAHASLSGIAAMASALARANVYRNPASNQGQGPAGQSIKLCESSLEGHKDCGGLDGSVLLGDGVPLQRLPAKQQPRPCTQRVSAQRAMPPACSLVAVDERGVFCAKLQAARRHKQAHRHCRQTLHLVFAAGAGCAPSSPPWSRSARGPPSGPPACARQPAAPAPSPGLQGVAAARR